MESKARSLVPIVICILACILFDSLPVKASGNWIVDGSGGGDFLTIQEAINAAEDGDLIQVRLGTYFEHIVINKSVSLIGEDKEKCVVDGNETGTVISIEADSVCISRLTVQQSGGEYYGVLFDQSRNGTIQESKVVNSTYGIWLNASERSHIKDNLVDNCVWGIGLYGSAYNEIDRNLVSNVHRRGLHFDSSDNNSVNENILTNNVDGLYLEFSSGNRLRNNNLTGNYFSFGTLGSELSHFIQDVDASNTIDGKPVCYWVNQSGRDVPSDAGYIAVVNSTRITMRDFSLQGKRESSVFAYTINSTIKNMYFSDARFGLRLINCTDISILENTFNGNDKNLRLDNSSGNTIRCNIMSNSHDCMFLDHSDGNLIAQNTFVDNIKGIFLYYSSHNLIHHNNFVNNEAHVFITQARILTINTWAEEGEGNYWSGYANIDLDDDGIGDNPYVLGHLNQDNSSLMGPYSMFPCVPKPLELICNSTISNFVLNSERNVITFDVTGTEGTTGFCRIKMPYTLFNGSYEVLIDGIPPLRLKEIGSTDSSQLIIYFVYSHTTRKVTIVPEYSLVLLLSVLFTSSVLLWSKHHSFKRPVEKTLQSNDRSNSLPVVS